MDTAGLEMVIWGWIMVGYWHQYWSCSYLVTAHHMRKYFIVHPNEDFDLQCGDTSHGNDNLFWIIMSGSDWKLFGWFSIVVHGRSMTERCFVVQTLVYLAIIKSNDILSSHYRPNTKSHHPSPTHPPSIVSFLFPLNHGAMVFLWPNRSTMRGSS